MNYLHAFHAGNFADVFKHAVIARILVHLREKAAPFRVIDTHAGAGLYDLSAPEATRTQEWRAGIGRLHAATPAPAVAALLSPYLAAVAAANGAADLRGADLRRYPGSPLLSLHLMRPQDRLTACEREASVAALLARHLDRDKRANVVHIDGWTALAAYVPPNERRGLVIVDPPYEDKREFSILAAAIEGAHRKWPTGTYLLWFPIKTREEADAFARRLRRTGIAKMLRAELRVGPVQDAAPLAGAGLIIINPPWMLHAELKTLLPALAAVLAHGVGTGYTLDWLAGEK